MTFPLVLDNALQFAHWSDSASAFILRDKPNVNESIGGALASQTPDGQSVDGRQCYLKAVYRDSTVSAAASRTRELFVGQYDATGQGRIQRIDTLQSSNAGNEVNWQESTDIALYSVNPAEVINSMRVESTIYLGDAGAPAFENNWVNYGGDFGGVGYYKLGDRVFCQGVAKDGVSNGRLWLFPEGYRPLDREIFIVLAGGVAARLDILETGEVQPVGAFSNGYVALSGVSFRVAP